MNSLASLRYLVLPWLLATIAAPASAQSLWELSPYRIEVRLAIHPGLTHQFSTGLLRRRLAGSLQSASEGHWRVQVGEASYADVRRWLTTDVAPEVTEQDKFFTVGVAPSGTGLQVSAREFDAHVMLWGDVVKQGVPQPSQIGPAIAAAIHEAFAPLAVIRVDSEGEITLQLRAQALPATQPIVAVGDRFQPVLRRNDRQGNLLPDGVKPIPWTHLEIVDTSADPAKVAVRSGLRHPLARRRRGNVQWFALRIKPRHATTVLRLKDRADHTSPLAGYELYQRDIAGGELRHLGTTNRRGELSIPAGNSAAAEWIVSSGRRRLAKLVVIPGQFAQVVAELDDDTQRLRIEGRLRGLQENLIDLVARRQVLIVRARAALDDGRVEAADALMDELRRLPGREQLTREIDQLRNRMPAQSAESSQALADKLFTETIQIVTQMLDNRPLRQLENALTAAKQADNE